MCWQHGRTQSACRIAPLGKAKHRTVETQAMPLYPLQNHRPFRKLKGGFLCGTLLPSFETKR